MQSPAIQTSFFKTPYGELVLGSMADKLCLCDWRYRKMRDAVDQRIQTGLKANYVEKTSTVIEETKNQLEEYFKQERTVFDIPLLLVGTKFQKRVWEVLLQIPYGKTSSYLGLSKMLGNEKANRAVAAANGANALSILVPCHRIIGSNGKLVGYAGGLNVKQKLLQIENVQLNNQLQLF